MHAEWKQRHIRELETLRMEEAAQKLPTDDTQDLRMGVVGFLEVQGQHHEVSMGGSEGTEGLGG